MNLLRQRPQTLILIAAVILAALFIRDPVWVDTGVVIGIHALIALSVGLCYGQAGLLSLAQAPLAAVGAYATGIVSIKFGWHPAAGLLVALTLPGLLGYLLARLVIRLEPLAVALATLALGTIVEIVLRNWDSVTGGYLGLSGIPAIKEVGSPFAYLLLTWGVVCVAVFVYENLMRSRFGRALNTVRHDRARAFADGVPVTHVMSSAFALSAVFAGASGWLYAHYLTYLGPGDLGTHLSISVVLMAVIGGVGYILGPVVGAIVLGILMRLLPAQEWQGLFYGGVLILILLVAKDGLLGLVGPRIGALWRRRAARRDGIAGAQATAPGAVPADAVGRQGEST